MLLCIPSIAQQADSLATAVDTSTNTSDNFEETFDAEFNSIMAYIATIFAGGAVGAFIVGFIITTLLLAIGYCLVIIKAVSKNIFIAFLRNANSTGINTFIYILSSIIGGITGFGSTLLMALLLPNIIANGTSLLIAVGGGIIGGVIIAYLSLRLVKILYKLLRKRWDLMDEYYTLR
jgi:hypothetical protein